MFDYTAPDNLLANRVILVTGAGDGIGRAAAMEYARLDATVILLGRQPYTHSICAQQKTKTILS